MNGDLQDLLGRLNPLTAPPTVILWVATKSNWTAYFDNFVNGSDPFPPISYLLSFSKSSGYRTDW